MSAFWLFLESFFLSVLIAMRGIASNQNKLSYYYGGREETARALAILI